MAVLIFGQGVFNNTFVKTNAGSTTWSILGTADDTSEVLAAYPYMSTKVWGNNVNTLSLTILFQVNEDPSRADSAWTTTETITLSTKNTPAWYSLTDTPIPVAIWCRYITTGGATNSGVTTSYLKILHSGWTNTRRN
jgi:hypothetical protein